MILDIYVTHGNLIKNKGENKIIEFLLHLFLLNLCKVFGNPKILNNLIIN